MTDVPARLQDALAGRYALGRPLGRGGMATVYLAEDLGHGRKVALKVLHAELATVLGPERFLREIRIAGQLQHPNILGVLDSGDADGLPWYTMPLVEGESLRDRIDRERQMPLDEALAITRQVAAALDHAHARGIVHRDIKPENILLSGEHVMVADFGIARALDAAAGPKLTETGLAVGTPQYMSPEQATMSSGVDARADVYSLGCVTYEMLAGTPPFTGPTVQSILARHAVDPVPPLRTVRRALPASVEHAIDRALAKVPADRFARTTDFARALTTPAPSSRRRPSRRLALGVVVGVAVALIAAVVASRLPGWRSPVVASAASIAVMPFTPAASDTALTRLGRDLMITVSSTLDHVGELRTIDRSAVLRTADRPTSYSLDEATRLARGLGAGSVVLGTLVHEGARVRVDLGVYETATHAPVGSGIVVRAAAESLLALSDSITLAVLRSVWRRGTPPSPFLADATTRSLPALREFLDAEQLATAGNWPDASAAYRRALAADSTFWVAAWRYDQAQAWMDQEADTAFSREYEHHLEAFAPRDRAVIAEETTDTVGSLAAHLGRLEALTRRYPDDWSVWFMYADHIYHVGPLVGYCDNAAVRAAMRRAVTLNPNLTPAWTHLQSASVGYDLPDLQASIAALTRLRGPLTERQRLSSSAITRVDAAGGRVAPGLLDSLARFVASSADPNLHVNAGVFLVWMGLPAAQLELNRLVRALGTDPASVPAHLQYDAVAWAGRGAWDSALVASERYVTRYPDRATGLETYELAVAGAWLGEVDPPSAAARRDAAARSLAQLPPSRRSPVLDATLAWNDGLMALLQPDRRRLDEALAALRHVDDPLHRYLARSLAALAMPPGTRARADSLALDERVNGAESDRIYEQMVLAPPLVPMEPQYATAIVHMAAAEALLATRDTARALGQLFWHESFWPRQGFLRTSGLVYAGRAYLMAAEIEEVRGRREKAKEYYEAFLRRYDRPSAAQAHLVTEAREAVRRLSGLTDTAVVR